MSGRNHLFNTSWLIVASAVLLAAGVMIVRAPIQGSSEETLVGRSITPIKIEAEWSQEWQEDQGTIALFRGLCRITQGDTRYTADSMVVWAHNSEEAPGNVDRLTVYLEGDVRIEDETSSRTDQSHWLELDASRGINLAVRGRATEQNGRTDPLYKRAVQRKTGPPRSKLKQTQMTVPAAPAVDPTWRSIAMQQTGMVRRIRIVPRSFSEPFSIRSQLSEDTTPPEQVTLITGGVQVLVDGVALENGQDFGVIDLTADRVVIYSDSIGGSFSQDQQQLADQKYQVYLEGNIVIRQHDARGFDTKIHASRAFYDVRDHRALVLDAELETYVSELDSSVRLRADRIRQNSDKNFHAQNAWVTTSRYGVPGYRVQAQDIYLENLETGLFADTAPPRVDPRTGQVVQPDHYWVTAVNSQFLVDQFPIFTAPRVSVPVEDITTSTPLQGVSFGMDRVFGVQARTTWDAFSLFGIQRPENPRMKLGLQLDEFSLRGPAVGFLGNYNGTDSYGNTYFGSMNGTYQNDNGVDNLGFDRRRLNPPSTNRGILQWENRYNFEDYNASLISEFGFITDRNYEESFRERQFDTAKDVETRAIFNHNFAPSAAYTIQGRTQFNGFENNTQWLPRGDLYFLGESFLNNLVNYSSHSSVGYAVMNSAAYPTDPAEVFTPLPYMTNAQGIVTQTRHELELPFNLGPVKLAPYIMGEAAYWGDSFSGDAISRLFGRTGLRGSISFQRIFPDVHSDIFNLNGLAHKSLVEGEYALSGSNRNLSDIPQWNEIDDNAQERFRMRFVQDTFGGTLPLQVDPRFYAVRSGAGATVTAPYGEMVDNQQVFRLNWHQRLQTKVGPPELQRVKDWMTLDLGTSIFPDANRDNYGQTFGLVSSRYVWNVGDRTSILASSLYDFFDNGQQLWSLGVLSQRSLRGSIYLGLRQVKTGPLDSQIATASYSYVLSPKWISTATTAYDFGQSRSAGQGFTLTRVGEWLLIHVGANVDVSKNNVGLGIAVEPRLGRDVISSTQLSSLLKIAPNSY